MDSLVESGPSMNWKTHDLEGKWKSFLQLQHFDFVFNGSQNLTKEVCKSDDLSGRYKAKAKCSLWEILRICKAAHQCGIQQVQISN